MEDISLPYGSLPYGKTLVSDMLHYNIISKKCTIKVHDSSTQKGEHITG